MGISLTSYQTALAASAAPYEADLLQAGLKAIAPVFRDSARLQEDLHMLARQAGATMAVATNMLARAWVGTASTDADGTDWLDFLAKDFGTGRQNDEPDVILRIRLRTRSASRGVIRSELLALAMSIVRASGVATGDVTMVEMPRDAAYFGQWTADSGTGGTFEAVTGGVSFTPMAGFAPGHPPCWANESGIVQSSDITFTSATSSGNDGKFTISAMNVDGAVFTNANAVAGVDAAVTWKVERRTWRGPSGPGLSEGGGGRAYFSRGCRMWRGKYPESSGHTTGTTGMAGIIMILPIGCTDDTARSVLEMLRQRAAGGVIKRVEISPP